MAIPFKRDRFRFQRQAELEQELLNSPLYAGMGKVCAAKPADHGKETLQAAPPDLGPAFAHHRTSAQTEPRLSVALPRDTGRQTAGVSPRTRTDEGSPA
jgi:hypothetical protein